MVSQLLINAIGNEYVFPTVVVEVAHERAPRPIRRADARSKSGFRKRTVAVIDLKSVVGKLMSVAVRDAVLVAIPIVERRFLLQTAVVSRQHFSIEHVGQSVVVHVGEVCAHRSRRAVIEPFFKFLAERPVFLIDIKVVALEKIVAHVYILPAVLVDVADHDAESKGLNRAINPRRRAHVREMPIVISKQFVSTERITGVA